MYPSSGRDFIPSSHMYHYNKAVSFCQAFAYIFSVFLSFYDKGKFCQRKSFLFTAQKERAATAAALSPSSKKEFNTSKYSLSEKIYVHDHYTLFF